MLIKMSLHNFLKDCSDYKKRNKIAKNIDIIEFSEKYKNIIKYLTHMTSIETDETINFDYNENNYEIDFVLTTDFHPYDCPNFSVEISSLSCNDDEIDIDKNTTKNLVPLVEMLVERNE